MRIIATSPAPAQVLANVTTAQIFPNLLTPTTPAILQIPGSNKCEQKAVMVRASGYITTATTTNVTISLYSGVSLTAGSNTLLLASTARAQNSASAPWRLEAQLIYDTVSGKLHGTVKFVVNNNLDAEAVVGTVVTAVSGVVEPSVQLCCGVTFSAANAGNIGNLKEFVAGF